MIITTIFAGLFKSTAAAKVRFNSLGHQKHVYSQHHDCESDTLSATVTELPSPISVTRTSDSISFIFIALRLSIGETLYQR